jgi:2-oxoglutarate ferredoxin oxidoreductase subunit alpha
MSGVTKMSSLNSVNDFVVKFANVNGSGSASANRLFAKSILRMGVPVSCRNIFPSNIQGLPTWYEVRLSRDGWLGCRGGVDLMVAMNPQTWDKDMAGIQPGGYILYDNSKPLPASKFRDDVKALGIPFTEIWLSQESAAPTAGPAITEALPPQVYDATRITAA